MRKWKQRLQKKRLPNNTYENEQTRRGWGGSYVEVVEIKRPYFTFYISLSTSFSREIVKCPHTPKAEK